MLLTGATLEGTELSVACRGTPSDTDDGADAILAVGTPFVKGDARPEPRDRLPRAREAHTVNAWYVTLSPSASPKVLVLLTLTARGHTRVITSYRVKGVDVPLPTLLMVVISDGVQG